MKVKVNVHKEGTLLIQRGATAGIENESLCHGGGSLRPQQGTDGDSQEL